MTTYPDSVQFLYALGNEVKTIKLGLERIEALMAALGHPQRAYRTVHVAGTNGKGSTCAMIESGLRASGLKTGLTISPHLVQPTERVQINRQPVTEEEFAAAFHEVHEISMRMVDEGSLEFHPTYFETVTAMAFVLFRQQGVDVAVVETGLGGRLDATNVVQPELSVITPVDFDHESWLGHSIEEIAGEKAGILKANTPAVISAQRPEAETVIRARAEMLNAPLILTDNWSITQPELHPYGCRYRTAAPADYGIECNLAGEHQVQNSLTAVAALHQLGVARAAIERGVSEARWPGRLERIRRDPDVILDGAHNPAGIRALAAYLRRFFQHRKVWLIYGTMRDKSVGEIGELLSPLAHEIILTAADSSRALRPEALAPLFDDHPRVRTAARLKDALELTRAASPEDAIFITGSLLLVGEAYSLLP